MSHRPLIILFALCCLQQRHLLSDMSCQYQNLLQGKSQQPWTDEKDDFVILLGHSAACISQGSVCLLMRHRYFVFSLWPTIIPGPFSGELLLVGLVFPMRVWGEWQKGGMKCLEWMLCSLVFVSLLQVLILVCSCIQSTLLVRLWLGCVLPGLDVTLSMLKKLYWWSFQLLTFITSSFLVFYLFCACPFTV